MKRWRTTGKGRGFAGLPLQPVNFGLKVEVRSCRQIYIEMYEKKNNNSHLQKFTQASKHLLHMLPHNAAISPYCIVEILGGRSSEPIRVERGQENQRKLELVLGYIRGKFSPNSNCCFWQRDVSRSILVTWMMMTKNVPSSMGKTY